MWAYFVTDRFLLYELAVSLSFIFRSACNCEIWFKGANMTMSTFFVQSTGDSQRTAERIYVLRRKKSLHIERHFPHTLPTASFCGLMALWIRWSLYARCCSGRVTAGWLVDCDWNCSSHVVFTVVDVHLVCPTLMTHPLQTGALMGGALGSPPCCGWVLPFRERVPVLCPASLYIKSKKPKSSPKSSSIIVTL